MWSKKNDIKLSSLKYCLISPVIISPVNIMIILTLYQQLKHH